MRVESFTRSVRSQKLSIIRTCVSDRACDEINVACGSRQFGIFSLSLFEDGDVRVGVFPEGEEVPG